jgi:hypothetical protein
MQSVWHGYSKKVTCESRIEVMKIYHNSRNRHLWNDMVEDH